MRERLFEDSTDMPNVHETISLGGLVDAQQTRESLEGKHVCPYCGAVNDSPAGPCPNCSLENTPAGRKATKSRIGPWYVLQRRNPAAPGMKYEMLLNFVRKGRIKPRTVVRGPTTHQLWRFAAHVKGLSREFGLCYSCGGKIEQSSTVCPQCNRLQLPPLNPDALLESGDAESPPGGVPMSAGAAVNGSVSASAPTESETLETVPDEVVNHDIVVPALTDLPGLVPQVAAQPVAEVQKEFSPESAAAPSVVPAPSAADPAEAPVAASAPLQSMALTPAAMPSVADPPVGARARSAALKAGGVIGPAGGPRIVPLGPTGASPTPLLTADPGKIPVRPAGRGQWRGAAEMVLFLIVLIVALGGALLLVNTSLREQAQGAYDRVLKATHLKSDSDSQTPIPPEPVPANPTSTVVPAPAPAPPPLAAESVAKPAVVAVKPAAPAPAPAAPPAVHTAPQTPSPPAVSDSDSTDDTQTASAQARAKELYFAAIDAETRSDWATAVSDYRKILQLPKSVQYTDVGRRLQTDEGLLAQSQSASQSH